MADFTSIAAVGSSIVRYLDQCFELLPPVVDATTTVHMMRTEDLEVDTDTQNGLSLPWVGLFLYRVDFNKSMRAAWSAIGNRNGESHMPLDLHFLFIPWGTNADHEYRIVGRLMQCMESMPILSGPLLDPITNWAPNESIQICLEDIPTEDLMRIFDSLPLDYKLCVPYVARVVVINSGNRRPALPVTQSVRGLLPEVAE